jgi:predicted  nucleic acid-binding Zn-ribbon protein
MKPDVKRILTKLSENKVDLKNQKIELTFVMDANKLIDEIDDSSDYIFKLGSDIDGAMAQINALVDNLSKLNQDLVDAGKSIEGDIGEIKSVKAKIKKAADELGADPKSIKVYNELDDMIGVIKKAKDEASFWAKESKKPFKI